MRNSYFTLLSLFFACLLTACNSNKEKGNQIMVTIEPQRYFAEQLAQPFFSVSTMVPQNNSPETYDPTPNQMAELNHYKAYWAIGGLGFENTWLRNIQKNIPKLHFFKTSKGIVPIVNHIDHGDHSHDSMDPHIWTSPNGAKIMVQNMYESLLDLDPDNKDTYAENLQKVNDRITRVDEKIKAYLANSTQRAFIIYHPTLSYFARDYGLVQHCIEADGKEPSPEQLKNIIRIAQEENIRTVFVQEEFDKKNAETIAKETGTNLVVINPLSYNWEEEVIKIAQALANE